VFVKTLLLVSSLLLAAAAFCQTSTYAIQDVTVIPMDHETVVQHQTVIVTGGKITAVTPAKSAKLPKNAQVIDGRGKYLIPGLTDAHVHLMTPAELPLYLVNGVTTVFNLDGRPAHLLWKKEVAEGKLLGPTIFSTGPIFYGAKDVTAAVKEVDDDAAAGYDAFKIYNPVKKDQYAAVAAEVHKKNLLFIGHIARDVDVDATLSSGQSIAHMEEFTYTYFNPKRDDQMEHIVFNESLVPDLAKQVKASGVYVVPTIDTFHDIVRQATDLNEFLTTPSLKYVAPWVLSTLQPGVDRYAINFKPDRYQYLRDSYAFQLKLIKAFEDAGVPIMSGTDSMGVGPVAGFSTHNEVAEMVKSGLTPFQALQTSTINPATYFREADSAGTIAVGKKADLVLLEANPLDDIANTRKIAGVMVHGQWFDQAKLKDLLDSRQAAYAAEAAELKKAIDTDIAAADKFERDNDPLSVMSGEALRELIVNQGYPAFAKTLERAWNEDRQSFLVKEAAINQLGYALISAKHLDEAVAVLKWNTEHYPQSANTWDSLGEAYADSGDMNAAVTNYRKALEVNAKYPNAEAAKRFVEEHQGK
jgi:imidazolonepropionase-like amidohydrolase/predicted negative regulator of RcsB-dependent stress response